MRGLDYHLALGTGGGQAPAAFAIRSELLHGVTHQNLAAAARHDLVARRVPHHAGAEAGVAERLEQRLHSLPVVRLLVEAERALEPVGHRAPEREALDALGGPVGAHLVA